MEFLTINELQPAMAADSHASSRAISRNISSEADIRSRFDQISYAKGASIIRMMQSFLGENAFKDGLRTYLTTYKFKNADRDDLWNKMTESGHNNGTLDKNLTVKEIMDTWTTQPGYPVLNVKRDGSSIIITQKRYMLPAINENDTQTWNIPITYVTQGNHDAITQKWLLKNETNLTLIENIDSNKWFYLNVERSAYYRVNYDYNSWVNLSRNFDELPPVVVGELVDDALNLARAEVITYDIPLTLLMKLGAEEKYYIPWAAASPGIEYLTNMLIREPAYEHFRVSHSHTACTVRNCTQVSN